MITTNRKSSDADLPRLAVVPPSHQVAGTLDRENDSPTSSSLFFQSASAVLGSSAYPRTPSLMALMVTCSGTTWPTWQFSQYRPPISSAEATTPAHTEVAAP